MNHIDFHNIEVLGDSKQSAFEDLCLHLFCRELKVSVIDSYRNQPGIEIEPVIIKNKKFGFQVKYFEGKFDWDQIKHSLLGSEKKTKSKSFDDKFPDNVFKKYSLNKVYIYSNREKTLAGRNKTISETLIDEVLAKYKCQVKYVCDKAIQLALAKPFNRDLAQLYFGVSDELGLIKKTLPIKALTFLSSKEYLNLPLVDDAGIKIKKLNSHVLSNKPGVYVLLGSPGSGKSILIRKLFQELGGLDQLSEEKRIKLLTKNKLVPLLVNLKDCAFDSIDNILRSTKSDFNLTKSDLGFFYLFDGLDELSEEKVDAVLSYIYQLSSTENGCKILISCRKGNVNKRRLKSFFSSVNEVIIDDLGQSEIDTYFKGKNNKGKIKLLNDIKVSNLNLLLEIKDILLADLLWQTIEDIDENSTITDLLGKKVDLLLDDPSHLNSLNDLNLLNPKKDKVVALLQNISFEYHDKRKNKFQFRFYMSELQRLILDLLPRSDYRSVNKIINYISDLFFDASEVATEGLSETYIFRHRRYQEYFFAQKLKVEYEQDPQILRKLNVISGKDFFEDLFLPYLRNEYTASNNLQGLVDINLIDVYLGNHSGFGVDDSDYMSSTEFLGSLLSQDDLVFYELMGDSDLNMEERFFVDVREVEKLILKVESQKEGQDFYNVEGELKSLWEDDLSSLITDSVLFWKSGRKDFSLKIQNNFSDIRAKVESSEILELLDLNFEHPCWKSIDDYLYLKLIIKNENAIDILNGSVRRNYSNVGDDEFSYRQSGKDKLIGSYLRLIIHSSSVDKADVFKELNSWEKTKFISVMFNYLSIDFLFEEKELYILIKNHISTVALDDSDCYLYILAFKKLLGVQNRNADIDRASAEWEEVRDERPIDWVYRGYTRRFALSSFVLGKFSFEGFLEPQTGHPFRYYNEQGLYAALYNGLIQISAGLESPESVVGDFVKYISFYSEGRNSNNYLSNEISKTLAIIFSRSDSVETLRPFLDIINAYEISHFNLYLFYLELHKESSSKFDDLVRKDDLSFIYIMLSDWQEEYKEYVDICFSLSRMLSGINKHDARLYFYKAINYGVLRHGWRKDTLVSYGLVDALDTIWSIGACSKEELLEHTKKTFNLTRKVVELTDGKGTNRGQINVLSLISKYDTKLTEYLYQQLDQYSWQANMALGSVISSKVKFGYDLDIISEDLLKFNKYYSHGNGVDPEYYDQRIIALLKITDSYFYTAEEKRQSFDKIRELIENSSSDVDRVLKEEFYNNYKRQYNNLCEKYEIDKKFDLNKNTNEDREEGGGEHEFIKEIDKAVATSCIKKLYVALNDYEKKITLSKRSSWELLLNKTYAVCGDIQLFIDLLNRNYYPHSDGFSRHSKYFHLAMSVAIKDINTKEEIFMYLKDSTGHGGFSNLIKVYSINNDADMCMKLFRRYFQLCELLVK